jgi:hypothetical protein
VLGQSVLLDTVPHTIVGVLPPTLRSGFFKDAEVFTTLVLIRCVGARDQRDVVVTGVSSPDLAATGAHELDTIASQLRAEHPATNHSRRVGAPARRSLRASTCESSLTILSLIGCWSSSWLRQRRERHRRASRWPGRHELAVHAALGATRADSIPQLMTGGARSCQRPGPRRLSPRRVGHQSAAMAGRNEFAFAGHADDQRVFTASVLIACATPLCFGLLPRLAARAARSSRLRDGGTCGGRHSTRPPVCRHAIVGLQARGAMILMVQIGLFIRRHWKTL